MWKIFDFLTKNFENFPFKEEFYFLKIFFLCRIRKIRENFLTEKFSFLKIIFKK